MSRKNLKFQGFRPSDFTHTFLEDKLNRILEQAPYGSNLDAVFTRKGRSFKGVITIYSSAGRFFATASGTQLKAVCNQLIGQIRRQLQKWKSNRFSKGVSHERETVA